MTGKKLAWMVLAFWALAYGGSLAIFGLVEPSGSGFTRGLNRVTGFFGWQIGAAFLAMIVWYLGRHFDKGTMWRWLCRVPLLLAAGLVLLVVGLILVANLNRPSSQSVTAPTSVTQVEPKATTALPKPQS